MAAAKPKKRKFMYPGMLMEETDSSSNSSITHSNENQPQQKEKSVHPQIISSPITGPSNAHRRKFKYPGMLMEESDDSLADQETQIDGEQGEDYTCVCSKDVGRDKRCTRLGDGTHRRPT